MENYLQQNPMVSFASVHRVREHRPPDVHLGIPLLYETDFIYETRRKGLGPKATKLIWIKKRRATEGIPFDYNLVVDESWQETYWDHRA